jgi:cytochrome P450
MNSVTVLELLLLPVLFTLFLYLLFLAPPRYPVNIPAVPFWVTLLPFFYDVDQEETYQKYLEQPLREHGAVKIFFGARWNILVARPEFMQQVFRDEDLFKKSGNQEKIPHSVFAELLGDNIISAHGEGWKLYRSIIKPGLQKAFDTSILHANTEKLIRLITAQSKRVDGAPISVQDLLQRFTIANTSQVLLQMDVKVTVIPGPSGLFKYRGLT